MKATFTAHCPQPSKSDPDPFSFCRSQARTLAKAEAELGGQQKVFEAIRETLQSRGLKVHAVPGMMAFLATMISFWRCQLHEWFDEQQRQPTQQRLLHGCLASFCRNQSSL